MPTSQDLAKLNTVCSGHLNIHQEAVNWLSVGLRQHVKCINCAFCGGYSVFSTELGQELDELED